MFEQLQELMNQLGSLSDQEAASVGKTSAYLLVGGTLALYVRWLYGKFGASASDADSFTRVFPLLVIVTGGVIAIVKSSLALSLGMVGALSIVRFRAAIKEPEELAYLFLCVGIGLSLGAEQLYLAIAFVVISSIFVIGMSLGNGRIKNSRYLLTMAMDTNQTVDAGNLDGIVSTVEKAAGKCVVQRMDVEQEETQIRIMLPKTQNQVLEATMGELRKSWPNARISYVNLNTIW